MRVPDYTIRVAAVALLLAVSAPNAHAGTTTELNLQVLGVPATLRFECEMEVECDENGQTARYDVTDQMELRTLPTHTEVCQPVKESAAKAKCPKGGTALHADARCSVVVEYGTAPNITTNPPVECRFSNVPPSKPSSSPVGATPAAAPTGSGQTAISR